MALEIIRGESYDIGLILENITLEIISGGVCTANVTISSDNFLNQMSLCTSLGRYIS